MIVTHLQEISFTIAAGSASGTGTLSGFSDVSKMVPLFLSWRVADGQSPCLASNTEIDIVIDSTTQLSALRAQATAYAVDVTAFVVQFGSDTTVQTGSFSILGLAATGTAAISEVTLANSFCLHHRMCDEGGSPTYDSRPSVRMTSVKFSSSTSLEFRRGSAAYDYPVSGHWWVVSSETLTVQHRSFSTSSSNTVLTDTITAVDLAHTFLISTQSNNNGTFNGEACTMTRLENATTVRWQRNYSSTTAFVFEYQVITDTSITVQRGTATTGQLSNTQAITAVDLNAAAVKSGDGSSGYSTNSNFQIGTLPSRYYELKFNSNTEIGLQTRRTSAASYTSWEVVEFSVATGINATVDGAIGFAAGLMAGTTKPIFSASIAASVLLDSNFSGRTIFDHFSGQIDAHIAITGEMSAMADVPEFLASITGQVRIESAIVAGVLEIIIVSEGAVFNPRIDVIGTPEIRWTFADGATSDSTVPTKNYGSDGTRVNRLTVTPWSALQKINLGYDGADGGGVFNPESDFHPAQDVSEIRNLNLVRESLVKFYASYTEIISLDCSGCSVLDAIEIYRGALASVDLAGCSALRRVCVESCALTEFDVSECAVLEDIRAADNYFSSIGFADTHPELWHLCVRDGALTSLPPIGATFPKLRQLWSWGNHLTGDLGINTANTELYSVLIHNCDYTGEDLQGVVTALLAVGRTFGVLDMRSNATPMSPEGCAIADALDNIGWTVYYDPPAGLCDVSTAISLGATLNAAASRPKITADIIAPVLLSCVMSARGAPTHADIAGSVVLMAVIVVSTTNPMATHSGFTVVIASDIVAQVFIQSEI